MKKHVSEFLASKAKEKMKSSFKENPAFKAIKMKGSKKCKCGKSCKCDKGQKSGMDELREEGLA